MIEKRFRDKFMAKLLVEELMDKMLVETPTGLKILGEIKVAGFDQHIVLKDMTEDYGWLGGWMHLSDMIGCVSSQSGRIFNEAYRLSPEWISRVEPISTDQIPPENPVLDKYREDINSPHEMSAGLIQLTMRLALMESISIDSRGLAVISAPDYQERSIKKAAEQQGQIFPLPERDASTQDMFFSLLRKSIYPALAVNHEHALDNTKDT